MYDSSLFSLSSSYKNARLQPEPYKSSGAPNYPDYPDYEVALLLALGILGVTICILCAPFAWRMSGIQLRYMEEKGIYEERTLVQLSRYLGIAGTLLLCISIAAFFLMRATH